MIIHFPRPIIFIHIPRTAGSSIEHALLPASLHNPEWNTWDKIPMDVRADHMTDPLPKEMHYAISDYANLCANLVDYYIFCFVRNPWDRLLSLAKFYQPKWDGLTLSDCILKILTTIVEEDPILARSQSDYYRPNGEEPTKHIFMYEHLTERWPQVCEAMGFEKTLDLPHVKATEPCDYRQFYDYQTRRLVEKHECGVISDFGYTF